MVKFGLPAGAETYMVNNLVFQFSVAEPNAPVKATALDNFIKVFNSDKFVKSGLPASAILTLRTHKQPSSALPLSRYIPAAIQLPFFETGDGYGVVQVPPAAPVQTFSNVTADAEW